MEARPSGSTEHASPQYSLNAVEKEPRLLFQAAEAGPQRRCVSGGIKHRGSPRGPGVILKRIHWALFNCGDYNTDRLPMQG